MVTILIHHYEECLAAFREAKEKEEALTIMLPPAAVCYMGLLYIHTMLQEASRHYSGVSYHYICDCGEDASLAQEALALGFTHVGYSGPPEVAGKLASIARHYGGTLTPTTAGIPPCAE